MTDNQKTFQYTYSVKEQEELRKIRSKYLPKEEDGMAQVRRLDAQVTQRATLYALIVGFAGAMLLGVGMCCCMVWGDFLFMLGVPVGIAGMAVAAMAYPVYNRIMKREQARVAPQILRLTEALMK